MANVYSTSFAARGGLGPGGYDVLPALSQHTAVIRDVTFVNMSPAESFFSLHLHGTELVYVLRQLVLPDSAFHIDMRLVVPDGYFVQADSGAADWSFSVSGYLFIRTAEPDSLRT